MSSFHIKSWKAKEELEQSYMPRSKSHRCDLGSSTGHSC